MKSDKSQHLCSCYSKKLIIKSPKSVNYVTHICLIHFISYFRLVYSIGKQSIGNFLFEMRENKINRSNFLWIDFSGFFQGLFCFSQLNSTISWTHTSSYPLPDSSREFSSSDSTGESTGMSSIGESTAKLYKNNVIHVIKNWDVTRS